MYFSCNRCRETGIWTRRIKELLAKLGETLHYQVAVGGFRHTYEAEWLYDIDGILHLINIGGISRKYKTEHRVCGTGQIIKLKESQLGDY